MRNVDYVHLTLLGVIVILLVIRVGLQIYDRRRKLFVCPVCLAVGLEDSAFKRNHDICQTCHYEFGYEDSGRTIEEMRQEWLKAIWYE